jgi:hypothetical protein
MVRRRRARRQEREYLGLSRRYHELLSEHPSRASVHERSLSLLRQRWPGPARPKESLADVRVFIIDKPSVGGPWFLSELTRACEAEVFNLVRYVHCLCDSTGDPLEAARSFDPRDRTAPSHHRRDYRRWRAALQKDLLRAVREAHQRRPLDLVFAYGSHLEFAPETLRAIQELGIPVALLCLDDKHLFEDPGWGMPNGQKALIGSCHVHLTNSIECVGWYVAEGVPAYYFPQGTDTEMFAPRPVKKDFPVSFLGAAYGMRGRFVRRLRDAGVPITCFGNGWENGFVDDDIDIYCRSTINLGIGGVGYSDKISCVKGRDLESPATGGLYLTTYDAELAGLFAVGREILCYHNEIDCIELIRHYLASPEKVDAIGRAGRERCLRQHRWAHRLEGLLRWMGLLAGEAEDVFPREGVCRR